VHCTAKHVGSFSVLNILTHSDHFYIQRSLIVFADHVLISQAMLILRCPNDLLLH